MGQNGQKRQKQGAHKWPLNISVIFMLASFFWDALYQVPVWYQRLKLVAGEPRVRGQGGGGGGVGGQRGGASTA